jgi:aminoglycoside phosphotransferase (APT) family kinase protein
MSPLEPSSTDDDAHQLKRTGRSLDRAAAAVPALRPELDRAFELLGRAHAALGPRPLVPVHGAAHLGQWLVDDRGRLGLVDFDRFARGEPEFDLATFVVELGAAVRTVPEPELGQAVLDGYRGVAGEVDEQRFRLYLVHKQLGRVVRAAAGLRPDGPEGADHERPGVMTRLQEHV